MIFWTPTSTTLQIRRRWTGRRHLLIDAFRCRFHSFDISFIRYFFFIAAYLCRFFVRHIYAAYCTACPCCLFSCRFLCCFFSRSFFTMLIYAAFFMLLFSMQLFFMLLFSMQLFACCLFIQLMHSACYCCVFFRLLVHD